MEKEPTPSAEKPNKVYIQGYVQSIETTNDGIILTLRVPIPETNMINLHRVKINANTEFTPNRLTPEQSNFLAQVLMAIDRKDEIIDIQPPPPAELPEITINAMIWVEGTYPGNPTSPIRASLVKVKPPTRS